MEKQHLVVLSLGSNQGNRLENIEQCIAELHRNVGTITKVSKLYETPSWGFESDKFYNCAVVMNSTKEAQILLEECLILEEKLGRKRTQESGYQPRVIDIDVIAYDEEIIATEKLKVPHPEMHNRLFVLLPMLDLNLDWRHPIYQKYPQELLLVAQDKSNCKVIQKLASPIENINLSKFNYIAIEGNIGAGKTTLTHKLAYDFNAKTVLERFAENPFLPKFYEDQSRFAFPLEMSFLADRYQQISDDLAQFDLFKDFIIADYHIFKSLIFAKITLAEDEYRLYKTMFDIIYKEIPKPDLYIYIYQNTERLMENIKHRGRVYEQDIQSEYLTKINNGYLDFIKTQKNLNVLIIDASEKDFLNNHSDYIFILDEIQKKISPQ